MPSDYEERQRRGQRPWWDGIILMGMAQRWSEQWHAHPYPLWSRRLMRFPSRSRNSSRAGDVPLLAKISSSVVWPKRWCSKPNLKWFTRTCSSYAAINGEARGHETGTNFSVLNSSQSNCWIDTSQLISINWTRLRSRDLLLVNTKSVLAFTYGKNLTAYLNWNPGLVFRLSLTQKGLSFSRD